MTKKERKKSSGIGKNYTFVYITEQETYTQNPGCKYLLSIGKSSPQKLMNHECYLQ